MNLEDHELDAMLRDVTVPPGLRDDLKRIPFEAVPVSPRPTMSSTWRVAAAFAIAASLIGITCWLVWPASKADQPIIAKSDGVKDERPGDIAEANAPEHELILDNTGIELLSAQIAELQWQIESRKQTARLAELRRTGSTAAGAALQRAERDALTMYLTSEAASVWGAGHEFVRAEMQQVIARYPETAGANRAREFLKHSTKL